MYQNKKCREPLAIIAKGSLHDTQGLQGIMMAGLTIAVCGQETPRLRGRRLEHEGDGVAS